MTARRTRGRTSVALAVATVWAACAGAPAATDAALVGVWDGPRATAFHFFPDGTAWWIFRSPAPPDTFRVTYAFHADETPRRLDLTGFDRGVLAGRTLYCIADLDGPDVLRMDCEPGPAGAGPAVRPRAFSDQTHRYHARR